MTRFTPGITLGLILALTSIAEAKTVSIDYTGASPVSMGLTQVSNAQTKDGTTVIAQRGGKNVAMTGNRTPIAICTSRSTRRSSRGSSMSG